jgi:DNA-binding FadR family transcriptional regulator
MQDGEAVKREDHLFRSVRSRRVSEQIAQQLQTAIFAGHLKPGDRLPPERELVDQFQASRASVREATRTLELAGLVAIRAGAGGGAYVTEPNFDMVANALRTMLQAGRFEEAELHQARLLLEPGVAFIAARTADAEDIALLRASLERGRERLAQNTPTAPESYNFHFLLAKASKSNLLLMLISSLLDLVHKSDTAHQSVRRRLSQPIVRAHEGIIEAIERHDAIGARHATREHLLEVHRQVTLHSQRLAS